MDWELPLDSQAVIGALLSLAVPQKHLAGKARDGGEKTLASQIVHPTDRAAGRHLFIEKELREMHSAKWQRDGEIIRRAGERDNLHEPRSSL